MKRFLVILASILTAVVLGFGGLLFFNYADTFFFGPKSGSRAMLSIVLGMIFSALLVTSEIVFLRRKNLKVVAKVIAIIYFIAFAFGIFYIGAFGGFEILFNIETKGHLLDDEPMVPLSEIYSSEYLESISNEKGSP